MTNIESSLSIRLAELNQQILQLESERADLLRHELANAEKRAEEIARFIGVYSSSSTLKGSVASGSKTTPKKSSKKTVVKKQAPIGASKKKATSRGVSKADRNAARLENAIAIVSNAGTGGISASQLAEKSGIPYGAVSKIVKTSGKFRQVGEKRASRIFLK